MPVDNLTNYDDNGLITATHAYVASPSNEIDKTYSPSGHRHPYNLKGS